MLSVFILMVAICLPGPISNWFGNFISAMSDKTSRTLHHLYYGLNKLKLQFLSVAKAKKFQTLYLDLPYPDDCVQSHKG